MLIHNKYIIVEQIKSNNANNKIWKMLSNHLTTSKSQMKHQHIQTETLDLTYLCTKKMSALYRSIEKYIHSVVAARSITLHSSAGK